MTLHQYQNAFIKTIADYLTRCRKVACQLATGGGKTVTFAGICSKYLKKHNKPDILPGFGKTILIIVHRIELLAQTRETCYNAFNITCQPIEAGIKYVPRADVYVCMVETLQRILMKPDGVKKFGDVGLVIIDEAHRLEFMKLHEHFPTQFILGFSATPKTASKKKPMKMFYDDLVCGIGITDLIAWNKKHPEQGLCQNITYAPKDTVDRLELAKKKGAITGGDFNDRIMGNEFSKVKYVHNTVESYRRLTNGTKALVFNVNIFHSKVVTEAFVKAGYDAKHLDSKMSEAERRQVIHWFKNTPGSILCNVGIATTGTDIPSVETVIINKSTLSMPLWLQMTGRGSRPTLAKSMFTIIDMGGNAITHGDWCQDRDWYEIFNHPDKPSKNSVAPVKTCPKCDGVIPASVRACPLTMPDGVTPCGFVFEKKIAVEIDLHDFIVVTKNIDVDSIIQENQHKKEHYPFFQIGYKLANQAKETIKEMTNERAEYILNTYYELAREWIRKGNEKVKETGKGKRRALNGWYKDKAGEHLFEQLAIRFPNWKNPKAKSEPAPVQTQLPLNTIEKINKIKMMHYEL